MNCLDFISDYPNLYILKQKSFSTNFGGFLFLVYLIIIVLVCIYKILDYTQNSKYTIEYFYHFCVLTNEEEEKQRRKSDLYNPIINFRLNLHVPWKWSDYKNRFIIVNKNNESYINNNVKFIDKIRKL